MYKRFKLKIGTHQRVFHTLLLISFIASFSLLNASYSISAFRPMVPQLVPAWSYTPGKGKIISPPIVSKGMIYLTNSQNLEAVNAIYGKKQWDFTSKGGDLATPILSNGIIYTYSDKIYAIDTHSGAEKWHFTTKVSSCGLSSVVDGAIYVVSNEGVSGKEVLYALDAISGKVRWSYETGGSYCSSLDVVDRAIYIDTYVNDGVNQGSKLIAVNASSGTKLWSHLLEAYPEYLPIIANGMLYIVFAYNQGNLMILDALSTKTGLRQWSYVVEGGFTKPIVVKGVIYGGASEIDLLDGNGTLTLYALDATSGNKLWSRQTGAHVNQKSYFSSLSAYGAFTSLALVNGVIYAELSFPSPKGDETLYALNAASGSIVWSSHLGVVDSISSSLVIMNGILYVGTTGRGKLYALNPDSGAQLLSYLMIDTPAFAPIVINDSVYSTSDSTLYALTIKSREFSTSSFKTAVFSPAHIPQAASKQVPLFADVPGLHIQSNNGIQCSSSLVLASDRLTYSQEELKQMRDYLGYGYGSYGATLPSTLRWVPGSENCSISLQISNVGDTPIQIRSVGMRLIDNPQSNEGLHLRAFNICSVVGSRCGGQGSGGGGCSLISVSIALKSAAARFSSFTVPLATDDSSCFEPTLNPNDTIDVIMNFTSPGKTPSSTAAYTYSALPTIDTTSSGQSHLFLLSSMISTAVFLSNQQFSCYFLHDTKFVLTKGNRYC